MTLTVRLPEPIESQLSRFCEAMGVSKSQVVQNALKAWFAKPNANNAHPLLAFAQTAAAAEPAPDWAGPYSKERLRARVLGASVLGVHEPEAAYQVIPDQPVAGRKAVSKNSKNKSTVRSKNKSKGTISIPKIHDTTAGTSAS